MNKEAENHTLQPDPPEGSEEVIDRELKRMEEKQAGDQSSQDADAGGGASGDAEGATGRS